MWRAQSLWLSPDQQLAARRAFGIGSEHCWGVIFVSSKASPIQASTLDIQASRPSLRSAVCAAWLACGALCACERYPESEYPSAPPPGVTVAEEDVTPAPPGTLWRRDVNAVLDAGLGRFLQRVELQPEVEAGAFDPFAYADVRFDQPGTVTFATVRIR